MTLYHRPESPGAGELEYVGGGPRLDAGDGGGCDSVGDIAGVFFARGRITGRSDGSTERRSGELVHVSGGSGCAGAGVELKLKLDVDVEEEVGVDSATAVALEATVETGDVLLFGGGVTSVSGGWWVVVVWAAGRWEGEAAGGRGPFGVVVVVVDVRDGCLCALRAGMSGGAGAGAGAGGPGKGAGVRMRVLREGLRGSE
jgi:hypothetical protein